MAVPANPFYPQAMVERFRAPGRGRPVTGSPAHQGPDRQRFIEQAQADFMDFAMVADAEPELKDGILTLRIDLRPTTTDD